MTHLSFVPTVDARLLDCTGEEVGELWLRSATRMLGYYGNWEETATVIREDGWLATGDLAQWLPDGQIAIVGRRKEMIIRSGFTFIRPKWTRQPCPA